MPLCQSAIASLSSVPCLFMFQEENYRQNLSHIAYEKVLREGDILFYEGEMPKALYLLLEGRVEVSKQKRDGTQIHLHFFEKGELIAQLATLGELPYPGTARCLKPSRLWAIPLGAFHSLLKTDPTLTCKLIHCLQQKLSELIRLIHAEVALCAEQKVAQWLSEHHDLIEILKKRDIASLLNMAPETLSRNLAKLQKEGLIATQPHIVVRDFEGLRAKGKPQHTLPAFKMK